VRAENSTTSIICHTCQEEEFVNVEGEGNRYYNRDEVYYHESTESYHLEEEEDDDDDDDYDGGGTISYQSCSFKRQDEHTEPGTLAIGLEYECYSENDTPREAKDYLIHEYPGKVEVSSDSSLGDDGIEIQTRPLSVIKQVELMESILTFYRLRTSDRCGLHVNMSWDNHTHNDLYTVAKEATLFIDQLGFDQRIRYFGRDYNDYCQSGFSPHRKFSAVGLKDDRIEFRLPAPSVDITRLSLIIANSAHVFNNIYAHVKELGIPAQNILVPIDPELLQDFSKWANRFYNLTVDRELVTCA